MAQLLDVAKFVLVLIGIVAVAMLLPAAHAFYVGDAKIGQAFLQISLIIGICLTLVLTSLKQPKRRTTTAQTVSMALLASFFILPAVAALPITELSPTGGTKAIYLSFVSSITTTGLPLEILPSRSIVLWHGVVAWLGGFLMWTVAWLIAFPEHIRGNRLMDGAIFDKFDNDIFTKVTRKAKLLAPFYCILTATLTTGLVFMGVPIFDAILLAFGTLSTTAVTIPDQITASPFWVEVIIAIFLVFALSRRFFEYGVATQGRYQFSTNTEVRLAFALVLGAGVFSLGADSFFEFGTQVWGHIFTAFSFLTTMGNTSVFFPIEETAQMSGVHLFLLGLALIGGGVGTTAGGVKLIRLSQLIRNSGEEMKQLIEPSHISSNHGAGAKERQYRAIFSWTVFMAVAMSIAMLWAILAMSGFGFETALTLSVATISNTGPVATLAGSTPFTGEISMAQTTALSFGMILGRLELLALVSILSSGFWRFN